MSGQGSDAVSGASRIRVEKEKATQHSRSSTQLLGEMDKDAEKRVPEFTGGTS
jgi:hypothetical protein